MTFSALLGRFGTLWVRRITPHGALLVPALDAAPEAPLLLLPRREVPRTVAVGDALEVFVHLDSEDRPIATLRAPRLTLGEVAFLTVVDQTPFGAFFDWGLVKHLLVPRREQLGALAIGERHPVGLVIDDTGRLAGTMRVTRMLDGNLAFTPGEWVDGVAWRSEPDIGLFVIVEGRALGLVPASEAQTLTRGEGAMFRVASVLPDGKITLSLRALAHEAIDGDARHVLEVLKGPHPPQLGDHSAPDEVRAQLGLSKKAFKRAVGRLLKEGAVSLDADGYVVPRV